MVREMYTEKKQRQTKSTSITAHSLVLKKNNNTESPPHPFVGLILVIYFFCKHESVIVICCNITASPYFSSFWGRCTEAKAEILHDFNIDFSRYCNIFEIKIVSLNLVSVNCSKAGYFNIAIFHRKWEVVQYLT